MGRRNDMVERNGGAAMSLARALTSAVFWLAITLWIGSIVAAGAAAASAFSQLPDLGITIEKFAAYDVEHHGTIAGGVVMQPIFAYGDMVQLIAGPAAVLAILIELFVFRLPWRRVSYVVRLIALAIALGLLTYRAAVLASRMNETLHAYWAAAEAGHIQQADELRNAFNADHPLASRLFSATLAALIVVVIVSPAAMNPTRQSRRIETS